MTFIIFGYGYTAQACAALLSQQGEKPVVTVRSLAKRDALRAQGVNAYCLDGSVWDEELLTHIKQATHVLVSAPPDKNGDPVLRCLRQQLQEAIHIKAIIYLSTIGVYGNFNGAWIDETCTPNAISERAERRLIAEKNWLDFGAGRAINTHVLRLAGIYGKGRNALCDFANGTARRIYKENQVFNRIHVDDIARVVALLLERKNASAVWNICDNEPCPPQDVVLYASQILGVEAPPLQPFETAVLTDMGKAFYSENKRVSNKAMRAALNFEFEYPTYREGLQALFAAGEGRAGSVTLRTKRH